VCSRWGRLGGADRPASPCHTLIAPGLVVCPVLFELPDQSEHLRREVKRTEHDSKARHHVDRRRHDRRLTEPSQDCESNHGCHDLWPIPRSFDWPDLMAGQTASFQFDINRVIWLQNHSEHRRDAVRDGDRRTITVQLDAQHLAGGPVHPSLNGVQAGSEIERDFFFPLQPPDDFTLNQDFHPAIAGTGVSFPSTNHGAHTGNRAGASAGAHTICTRTMA
jgi:hypothetical protein